MFALGELHLVANGRKGQLVQFAQILEGREFGDALHQPHRLVEDRGAQRLFVQFVGCFVRYGQRLR